MRRDENVAESKQRSRQVDSVKVGDQLAPVSVDRPGGDALRELSHLRLAPSRRLSHPGKRPCHQAAHGDSQDQAEDELGVIELEAEDILEHGTSTGVEYTPTLTAANRRRRGTDLLSTGGRKDQAAGAARPVFDGGDGNTARTLPQSGVERKVVRREARLDGFTLRRPSGQVRL